MSLWEWTENPSALPKVLCLMIIDGQVLIFDVRSANILEGNKGLRSRVLVHLDLHEDFMPNAVGVMLRCLERERFDWRLGVVDGKAPPPNAHSNHGDVHRQKGHNRWDVDDDDHRSHRDGRDRLSWSGWLFRSRPHALEGQHGDGVRDGRCDDPRGDDRCGDSHDGRRNCKLADMPDQCYIDPTIMQWFPDGSVILASGRRPRVTALPRLPATLNAAAPLPR